MPIFLRTAMAGAMLSTVLLAGAPMASAQEPFRIGAVLPFSGAFGVLGQNMRRGVDLAIEERGSKVLDRQIEVIWEDSETKPQVAVQKTSRLLAAGIDTLFGAASSGETIAMMPLAASSKVPHLVTMSADDRITGQHKTRYTFRTSNNLGMENVLVADQIKADGLKKVYGVAADVGTTREGWYHIRSLISENGVEIVGEDFPPIGSKDYAVIVDKILKSGADAVVFVGAGNDAIGFLKQSHEVGLGEKARIMGPVLIDETIAKAVGPGTVGVMSALRYHATLDNPENKRFVEAYRAKYGESPDWVAGEAYDGISWWLDVVEQTGSDDPEAWINAFAQSTRSNSIEGEKSMRACDHQAAQGGIWGEGAKFGDDYGMTVTRLLPSTDVFVDCE